jgi:hypothetical protein
MKSFFEYKLFDECSTLKQLEFNFRYKTVYIRKIRNKKVIELSELLKGDTFTYDHKIISDCIYYKDCATDVRFLINT